MTWILLGLLVFSLGSALHSKLGAQRDTYFGFWETFFFVLCGTALLLLPLLLVTNLVFDVGTLPFDLSSWSDWTTFLFGGAVGGALWAIFHYLKMPDPPWMGGSTQVVGGELSLRGVPAAAEFLIRDGPLKAGAEAFSRGDFAQALRQFEALADADSVEAMNNLGVLYEAGAGVEMSKPEAARCYRKAAESDIPMAKHNLAVLLAADHLLGTAERPADRERDFSEAFALFSSASAQGLELASRGLRDLRSRMTRKEIAAAERESG